MDDDSAPPVSRTAEYMALFRALESRGDGLFDDPLARAFLSPGLRAAVCAARVPFLGAAGPAFIDRRWPGAREAGVARARVLGGCGLASVHTGGRPVVLVCARIA